MSENIRIAIDAMGGDNAPSAIIEGSLQALKVRSDFELIFVGDEKRIREELKKYSAESKNVRIVHASETIDMSEHPVNAIRSKKDSSLVIGLKMVKNKEADCFMSAGNSGAVLVGGQLIVGRIRGISRPPFASLIPTEKGVSLLLDCGANVDARPEHLLSFARIGSIYMENVMGVANPSVGIVNIGAEEEKGNALVKDTYPLLKQDGVIRFIGSVEARDIPFGGCDVLVCEGFTGNVILKMYEGTASMLLKNIKKSLMSSLTGKIGGLLIKPSLKGLLTTFDATQYGGAPLLGLNGLVVKMHGSSKAKEVKNTVIQCADFTERKINDKIQAYAQTLQGNANNNT